MIDFPQFPILETVESEDYANYRHMMFTLPIALDAHCIVETGLGNGHSTRIFLESLAQMSGDRYLHTIEMSPNPLIVESMNKLRENLYNSPLWLLDVGKSTAEDMVKFYKFAFGDKSIDFLFIDSEHTYNTVYDELMVFKPYLSNKAWIMLDDCWDTGDVLNSASHTVHRGKNPSDVYYAAIDWCKNEYKYDNTPWTPMLFTETRGFGEKNVVTSGKLLLR